MTGEKGRWALGVLRLAMGWTFFWPFLDKVWGLGFATPSGKGWIDGVSPTTGFLGKVVHGPFASFFHALSGNAFVDWVFMIGLLLIGLSLILGMGVKIASVSGSIMLFLMWLSLLWPANNPFLDDHIMYILALWVLCDFNAGDTLGFGKQWKNTGLVRKYAWLA